METTRLRGACLLTFRVRSDGADAPNGGRCYLVPEALNREDIKVDELHIVGIDLAKQTFHLHGAKQDGTVLFRKKLPRAQMTKFFDQLEPCTIAMEACATAHFWGREMEELGHVVRLIPPRYVKPFVKRQKNDSNDAEAIVEAALRPTMRFVSVKSPDQQSLAVVYRSRDLLVRQRTQLVNALRAHLAEFGVVTGKGIVQVKKLAAIIEGEDCPLSDTVRGVGVIYLEQIGQLTDQIQGLEVTIRKSARQDAVSVQLQKIPGVGPIGVMALEAFAPPMQCFQSGRSFAAWLGLVPQQHSTGGKAKYGRASKMGQADIRRHLVAGAMSVIHWAKSRGFAGNTWLERLVGRKPTMVAAIALANKMARTIWAMLSTGEEYRMGGVAAA